MTDSSATPSRRALSDVEVARIKEEETIREAVRAVGRKTNFFHKPLGVFLLSSVVVGSISFWFTFYVNYLKDQETARAAEEREHDLKSEAQRKLDIEFLYRFAKVESYLDDAAARMEKDQDDAPFVYTHVRYLLDGQDYRDEKTITPLKPVFPEYAEKDFQPMILDLETVVWSPEDRAALEGLIAKYKDLNILSESSPPEKDTKRAEAAAISYCREMLDGVRKIRKQWTIASKS